ncbi:MAG: FHA domain-containing protein [Fimbriimonadales bacterium]|nr:FHA domain-containing protein [Fimbriimonadales bacterium]
MVQKLIYLMFFGAIGGLLAWLVNEPFTRDELTRSVDWGELARFGMTSGLCIGAMIGLASGLLLGTGKHMLRGVALGGLVSVLGGWMGLIIGQVLFSVLEGTLPIVGRIVGRILGWCAFGAAIGLSEGIIARSPKRIRNGLLGGAIGGALGGALFDALAFAFGLSFGLALGAEEESGALSRAVALVLVGAGIGLFIGLLEVITRSAWVRVIYGRNEGKDYPIDRDGAYIGRDELADVPLRGDPQVAPRHAEIRMDGGGYALIPHAPLRVNGQPVNAPIELNDGDALQIGGFQLQFLLREGQAQRMPRDVARSPLPPPPPTPPGVCPYCGQRQDPLTGACVCTPVATPPPPITPSAPTAYTPASAGVAVAQATALVGLDGALAGRRFVVPPGGLTVGRELDNALVVPDLSVSRHHARIVQENGALMVYDLGSTNGVYVNEQRVQQSLLKPGDIVRFGSARFRVE